MKDSVIGFTVVGVDGQEQELEEGEADLNGPESPFAAACAKINPTMFGLSTTC